MNTFQEQGLHYCVSVLHLTGMTFDKAPQTARQICEDACHLSENGNLSVEYLRAAGQRHSICHMLILRSKHPQKDKCQLLNRALTAGVESLLRKGGYTWQKVTFDSYAKVYQSISKGSQWALVKGELAEQGGMSSTYRSIPILSETLDLDGLYAALEGSGCAVSIQMTPHRTTAEEQSAIQRQYSLCSSATDGAFGPVSRDRMASFAQQRWGHFVQSASGPLGIVNVLVLGPPERAALVAARLKSCITDRLTSMPAPLCALDLTRENLTQLFALPWYCNMVLDKLCAERFALSRLPATQGLPRLLSSQEVGALMALPSGTGTWVGVKRNARSLLRRDLCLPPEMAGFHEHSLPLGTTPAGEEMSLPLDDLSLHMTMLGKSGSGKTTLLLNIIESLSRQGVSVLALEPVKREYRSLIRTGSPRIFTVEDRAAPFVLNPFLPPEGVSLSQYIPHLQRAFSAAFSMPDPLPSLFGAAITQAYGLYGWTASSKRGDPCVMAFGLFEFVEVFRRVISDSGYSAEVKGNLMSGGTFRLLSLLDRCPDTFDTVSGLDVADLLTGQVVVELGAMEGEEKCLVASLILISALAWLRCTRKTSDRLQNVILLDEAHVLLDANLSTSTLEGQAAGEMLQQLVANIVAEFRSLGVAVIVADQSPKRLGENLLDSTDTRVLFRLTGSEADAAAKALGLSRKEKLLLSLLGTGEALILNHRLEAPTMIKTKPRLSVEPVSDREVACTQADYRRAHARLYRPYGACSLCPDCGYDCDRGVWESAAGLSIRMFAQGQKSMKTPDSLIAHLLSVPAALKPEPAVTDDYYRRLCCCIALQLYRKARASCGVCLTQEQLSGIFRKISTMCKGGTHHE